MIRLEKSTYLGSNKKAFCFNDFVVTETVYLHDVSEDWHCHTNHHISFILEGGNLEQRKDQEFEASIGKLIFYPSGLIHRNKHTLHPSRNINLELDENFFHHYDLKFPTGKVSAVNYIKSKLSLLKIYHECLRNDVDTYTSIQSLLFYMFEPHQTSIDEFSPEWAKLILQVLHDRWNETLNLQDLSRELGLHPVTISKYFPKYFKCTIGEYMRKIKVDNALRNIKESQAPLTDIAYQCGFFDQSHFTKSFKQEIGFQPGVYRKL